MTGEQQPQVSAYARATAVLKRITKDAMVVDDIISMYQTALDERDEKIKSLTEELKQKSGEEVQPGEA